jgi:2-oxoglutarate dehydrogenase E1 component
VSARTLRTGALAAALLAAAVVGALAASGVRRIRAPASGAAAQVALPAPAPATPGGAWHARARPPAEVPSNVLVHVAKMTDRAAAAACVPAPGESPGAPAAPGAKPAAKPAADADAARCAPAAGDEIEDVQVQWEEPKR